MEQILCNDNVRVVYVQVSLSNSREVTLRAVQRELTGNYKCEVSADAPLFHTDIREAFMMVAGK